ncbi:MAG: phospho-N-acetylmuramoyl-pentapeptide-transferase, partial [Pseudomonadota bacterium]
MLHYFLVPLSDDFGLFNLFRYISFRTGGATITALIISFLVGPVFIRWLRKAQAGARNIREDVTYQHLQKAGTPTMGGVLILFSLIISTLLWMDITNQLTWFVVMITCAFGCIGGIDDYMKLIKKNSHGLRGRAKLLLQAIFAIIGVYGITQLMPQDLAFQVAVPFLKSVLLDFGLGFLLFGAVVIIGASNSVNLTDGLDGLAIVPVMICAACFALIAYVVGNALYAQYLQLHFVPGTGELTIFCGAIIG